MRQTRQMILNMVQAYSLEQLNRIPPGFKNNMIWNLAHLVAAQQSVCYFRSGLPMVIQQDYFEKYKPESKPEKEVTAAEFEEIKTLLFSTLDRLEQDIEKGIFGGFTPFTTRTGVMLGNFEEALTFLHFHDGLHAGVIMSQRKLV